MFQAWCIAYDLYAPYSGGVLKCNVTLLFMYPTSGLAFYVRALPHFVIHIYINKKTSMLVEYAIFLHLIYQVYVSIGTLDKIKLNLPAANWILLAAKHIYGMLNYGSNLLSHFNCMNRKATP